MDLIEQGWTNERIAKQLGISLAGAKYHVAEILSKLGVATRTEAIHSLSRKAPRRKSLWQRVVANSFVIQSRNLLKTIAQSTTSILMSTLAITFVTVAVAGYGFLNLTYDNSPPSQGPLTPLQAVASHPNTVLLAREVPAEPAEISAELRSIRHVSDLAELRGALTDSTHLIVIDKSALSNIEGSPILALELKNGRSIMGINVTLGELAKALNLDLDAVANGGTCAPDTVIKEIGPGGDRRLVDCPGEINEESQLASFAFPAGEPFFSYLTPANANAVGPNGDTIGDAAMARVVDGLNGFSIVLSRLDQGMKTDILPSICEQARQATDETRMKFCPE